MRSLQGKAGALLVAALLGPACGGEDEPRAPPTPDPAQAHPSRCGLPIGPQAAPPVVPEDLLPPGAVVTDSRRSGSGSRATILLRLRVSDALAELVRASRKRGMRIVFVENEGIEADLYVSTDAGLAKFKILRATQCPDASVVIFERRDPGS